MTNKEYIKLTKQLVAKKNKDCRGYLKEQKEKTKKEIIGEIKKNGFIIGRREGDAFKEYYTYNL